MRILRPARRVLGVLLSLIGATCVAWIVVVASMNPAGAEAAFNAVASSISCSTTGTASCLNVTNSSSGVAVYGTSKSGTGLRGLSTSNFGLKATSTSGVGVFGQSASGAAGVSGLMTTGTGVLGTVSTSGIGVSGSSPSGFGVYGSTTTGSGYGVVSIMNGAGTGAYGSSISGYGSEGITSSGTAVYAQATGTGSAMVASASSGYGLISRTAGNVPIFAQNTSGNAGDFHGSYIGIVARTPAAGFPFVATDPSGNDLFYVDGSGNVSYKGGLFTFAHLQNGGVAQAYSPKTTAPTIEDTGTAELVNGFAAVRLDPTFSASIDPTSLYRVVVTPNGDSRGLYVPTKTPNGFIVRESQGGHSSLSFDYHIVAMSLGHARDRMALVNGAALPGPHAVAPNPPQIAPARLPQPPKP